MTEYVEFHSRSAFSFLDGASLPEDLAAIPVPTLVMAGDDDEMPPEHLIALHRALPDARLGIVPGAGHAVLLDKPELCLLMIKDLLAGGTDGVPR